MRKKGTRKHLNFLLEDLRVEYHDTLRQTEKEKLGLTGVPSSPSNMEKVALELDREAEQSATEVADFTPPYVYGGVVARETAKMVNTKRTPSGNFFQITNPALMGNSDRGGGRAVISLPNTPGDPQKELTPRPQSQAPPPPSYMPPKDPKPWLTAQQKDDRFKGMKEAKMVNSRRTPNGGFFNKA